jgi:RHS repeat-associated protein
VRKVAVKNNGNLIEERIYLASFEIFQQRNGAGAMKLERETLHIMDDKKRIALVETRTCGHDAAPKQIIRYQFGNHLGSVSLELDDEAQIISYEEYASYGSTTFQAVRSQLDTPKRYRYTGKEQDEESGLYYHGARYYAPWLGRWISCDPLDLGSLYSMTNVKEKVVSQIGCDPYGGAKAESGSSFLSKYGFTEKEMDKSGLNYFGARYYDPIIGKFITPDPLGPLYRDNGIYSLQNLSLYSYVVNNPINLIDSNGLQPCGTDNPYCTEVHASRYPKPGDAEYGTDKWGTTVELSKTESRQPELGSKKSAVDLDNLTTCLEPHYQFFSPEITHANLPKGYEVQVAIVQPYYKEITSVLGHAALVIKNLRSGKQTAVSWHGLFRQSDLISEYVSHGRDVIVYTYNFSESEGKAIESKAESINRSDEGPCMTAVYRSLRAAESFKRADPWYSLLFRAGPEGLGRLLDIMNYTGRLRYKNREYHQAFYGR